MVQTDKRTFEEFVDRLREIKDERDVIIPEPVTTELDRMRRPLRRMRRPGPKPGVSTEFTEIAREKRQRQRENDDHMDPDILAGIDLLLKEEGRQRREAEEQRRRDEEIGREDIAEYLRETLKNLPASATAGRLAMACGVSAPAVSQWLAGKKRPEANKLDQIAYGLALLEGSNTNRERLRAIRHELVVAGRYQDVGEMPMVPHSIAELPLFGQLVDLLRQADIQMVNVALAAACTAARQAIATPAQSARASARGTRSSGKAAAGSGSSRSRR